MTGERLYRQLSWMLRESHIFGSHNLATIGVHLGQPSLLAAIAKGKFSNQKELADSLRLAPSTVNIMLGRMEKAGWVERTRCESNARACTVHMLPAGYEVLEKIAGLEKQLAAEAFAGLTDEEYETFTGLVSRVTENMRNAGPSEIDTTKFESQE